MNKEFWEKFKNNEIVVNCETKREFKDFLMECEVEKIGWHDGRTATTCVQIWEKYRVKTCIRHEDLVNESCGMRYGIRYGNLTNYESKGYEIIKFKDLIEPVNEGDIKTNRVSKEQYYMGIAKAVSKRSTCIRRQYGAVIVKDDRIVSTGYNGNPRGEANCIDVGSCYRIDNNVEHGTRYETCKAVHAEMNAIINAREDLQGADLYLYGEENGKVIHAIPCSICANMIKNARIHLLYNTKGDTLC